MPTDISLDNTLGASFVGILASTVIYGITCLQVYLYYTKHSLKDSTMLKVFVAFIMVLDTLEVALLAHAYYSYTVTHFGDYSYASQSHWSLLVQVAVGSFMNLCVQMFYLRRVCILSGHSPYIPILIIAVALAHFATILVYTVQNFQIHLYAQGSKVSRAWSLSAFGLDFVMDAVITAALIFYLLKNKTPFPKTNRMVHMLITYILNTCLLSTIFKATCLTVYLWKPDTLLYVPWYFVLIRLCSCSLMSTLNSRDHVRNAGTNTRTSEIITLSRLAGNTSASQGRRISVTSQLASNWRTV